VILLASSPNPDPNIKLSTVFERYAPPEIKQKIQKIANEETQQAYGALKLNAEQLEEHNSAIAGMQRSYLEHHLGIDATSTLLADEPLISVRAICDGGGTLRVTMEDQIAGYLPETGFLLSPMVLPTASIDAGGLVWIVPGNIAERESDPKANNRSLLRIYKMPF